MVQRLTYRRRHAFATRSNKVKKVRTPGGQLTLQYRQKRANAPKCGDCGIQLPGIPAIRPKEYRQLHKRERRISRAYGGNRCGKCVRQRIVRAFLIEEQKIVKHVLRTRAQQQKGAKEKVEEKPTKKK